MEPVLVDVLEQGLATHLLLAMVGHRKLHLDQLVFIEQLNDTTTTLDIVLCIFEVGGIQVLSEMS